MDLYDVIDNSTDEHRWQAIETLRKKHTLKEIAEKLDNVTYGSLRVWISNNRDKYELKNVPTPSLPHRNPPTKDDNPSQSIDYSKMTDQQIDRIPYGQIPPRTYISPLDHMEWGEHYLGHTWDGPYLEQMADQLWNRHKLVLQTGRHHGKTWTMIKLFARWLLEQRTQVICVSNKATKTLIYQAVKDSMTRAEIRRDYGDVIEKARENTADIWFVDEIRFYPDGARMVDANFMVVPADPNAVNVGKHASGGWIHLEDVVQDIKVSDEAEERIRHWFDRTIKYIAGKDTKITATGTRKDPQDFYWHLEENHYFPKLVQQALVVESGRLPKLDEISVNHEYGIITDWNHGVGTYSILGCPDYPIERLLYEFIFHPDASEAELNNNPLPRSGNYFDIELWNERPLPDNWHKQPKYIVMDPAFGGSSTSSKTAIIVIMIYQGRMWVIDMYINRAGLTQKERLIMDYAENYNPKQILIEDNFGQISTRYSQQSQLMRLRGLTLFEVANDKKERIGALDFPYRKHEIIIYDSCPYKSELKTEYLKFKLDDSPTVVRQQYNALDALASGYERLKQYLGKNSGWYARTW